MHTVKEIFNDIVTLANILEENDIDTFKFPKECKLEAIAEWEKENNIQLPQGYKEFISLTNGFRYGGTQILPLEKIEMVNEPEEIKGYYMLGSYIGDGSLLLSDKLGRFYCDDHAFGIKETDFSLFLEEDILYYMKDSFKENDIEIPDDLNTAPTEEEKRKDKEETKRMFQRLKEKYEKEISGTDKDRDILEHIKSIDEYIERIDEELKNM